MEKIHENNSLSCNPSSPQLQKLLFLLKTQKTTTLHQVTGANTPNIALKKMLRHFLKTPPLKEILQFLFVYTSMSIFLYIFLLKKQKNSLISKCPVEKHKI